jgi:hypothetical protein
MLLEPPSPRDACDLPHQVGTVKEGDLFRVETVEWTGGQIRDDDSAEDVKNVDLTKVCPNFAGPAATLTHRLLQQGFLGDMHGLG